MLKFYIILFIIKIVIIFSSPLILYYIILNIEFFNIRFSIFNFLLLYSIILTRFDFFFKILSIVIY